MDFSIFDETLNTLSKIFGALWGLISNNTVLMVLFYSSVASVTIAIFVSLFLKDKE